MLSYSAWAFHYVDPVEEGVGILGTDMMYCIDILVQMDESG
jgi:hypothetical protein